VLYSTHSSGFFPTRAVTHKSPTAKYRQVSSVLVCNEEEFVNQTFDYKTPTNLPYDHSAITFAVIESVL